MITILFLLAVPLCFAQDEVTADTIEREKLAFIERSIMQIYEKGDFPEIFLAELNTLQECGCTHGTQSIYWGAKVGMMCKLRKSGFDESCGQRCTTPKGEEILLLCPQNWSSDCFRGCVPPPFDSVDDRTKFLLDNVQALLQYGHDYLLIKSEYLETCKCKDRQAKLINYGTKLGFECVVEGEEEPTAECGGFQECKNDQDERVMIFCPAGHQATCAGCEATIKDPSIDTNDVRHEWAIQVLTGYIRESQSILDITPTHEEAWQCGCRSPLQRIDYGSRIGHFCNIDDAADMTNECNNKLVCADANGKELLHFCPSGFVADCERGCGYWWAQKEEL